VSGWLLLVSYVGKTSGRRYTFPVAYARAGDDIVVVTPRADTNWWKNFRDPLQCYVWFRGDRYTAIGGVVTGETATQLLSVYASTRRLIARELGLSGDSSRRAADLDARQNGIAVIRFTFDQ
jgi:hypothetical protein